MSDQVNQGENNQKTPPLSILKKLLKIYTLRFKNPNILFQSLLDFTITSLDRLQKEIPQISIFKENTSKKLHAYLENLKEKGECSLEITDGKIKQIHFPAFYFEIIQEHYRKMEYDIELPFPCEDQLGISIPSTKMSAINIKQSFITLIKDSENNYNQIFRLLFPEGVKPILALSPQIPRGLLELAARKIKNYLDNPRNSSYMEHKLLVIFRHRDLQLKEMLKQIITKSNYIASTLMSPSDFTFQFWAHFAHTMIQELRKKRNEMLPKELDACQAAYLIGFFNVYYKNVIQKEKEQNAAIKILDTYIQKKPYAFTISEISQFRDKKGLALSKKCSYDGIQKFLEIRTTPKDNVSLPEIIQIKVVDGSEVFIHKNNIIRLIMDHLFEASQNLRKAYLNDWIENLKEYHQTDIMLLDNAFLEDLQNQIREHYPLVHSLYRYELLYMCSMETKEQITTQKAEQALFDDKKQYLKPMNLVLDLDRKSLFKEAQKSLPIWRGIPVISHIIIFFLKLFSRKNKPQKEKKRLVQKALDTADNNKYESQNNLKEENWENIQPSKKGEVSSAYRSAIENLKIELVGKNMSVNEKLENLMEKWNPLYDSVAKKNLVDDVNSIIRDYLRRISKSFAVRPPDVKRIQTLAEHLSENRSFDEIKHKEYFKYYIEIYMIKLLGERIKGLKL
ncbi:MAG: hypothetical protein JXR70_11325 [Spirochaetales bacterium]|nr:hypothetical protein [Spirochaetales bacterium]